MITFKEYIQLNEIGNAGLRPYAWSFKGRKAMPFEPAGFMNMQAEMNVPGFGRLNVTLLKMKETLDVEFSTPMASKGSKTPILNLGVEHVLRVTTTIVEIALSFMKQMYDHTGEQIKKITWSEPVMGGGNEGKLGKRSKVYSAFIKKAVRGATVSFDNEGGATVKVPSKFYESIDESVISENVTKAELDSVEKFADKLFAKFDIDVAFTKHFADRVNDARNKPSITARELKQFFQKAFHAHAQTIANMPDGRQALLNDLQKELNLPFVYKWDGKDFEFDLVAKTIMRKKNFMTRDRVLRF